MQHEGYGVGMIPFSGAGPPESTTVPRTPCTCPGLGVSKRIVVVGVSEGVKVEVGGVSQSGVDVHTALDFGGGQAVDAANVKVAPVEIVEYER
jgi:hypothetical protein